MNDNLLLNTALCDNELIILEYCKMKTLYDKLWESHVVHAESDRPDSMVILYIDRHLVHEVTSPQAFEGLKLARRKPWRVNSILAVADHNVPTTDRSEGISDPISRLQVDTLDQNCEELGITEFRMNDQRQGIVHVIGPEQGATLRIPVRMVPLAALPLVSAHPR